MVAYRLKYFLPMAIYVLLVFALSSLNQTLVTTLSWGVRDFILHSTEYHFLGVFLIWAVQREKPLHELKASYRIAVGLGALIAILDELYQSFVPSRYSTIEDVVADVFGILLSIITFRLLMKIQKLESYRTRA